MQYDDVVLGRRSIRGYKPDPVPKALIREVIEIAMRAPSSLNTQPWNFYVVAGAPLDRIRAGNTERNLAGVPSSREFRGHGEYAGAHRERQIEIAKQLFGAMGIERHDKARRQDWVLRGFRQFDAPVSVVVTYDRSIHGGDIAPFDCGAIATGDASIEEVGRAIFQLVLDTASGRKTKSEELGVGADEFAPWQMGAVM